MDIAQALRQARKRSGLTQAALASSSGLQRLTIVKIENGVISHPRISTVAPIADALGISIDELVGREPPKRKRKQ